MLGIALGCIHLALDDFCRLTPEEFGHVYSEYAAALDNQAQGDWERMRLHASIAIQPHVKSRITPQRLLPLPWDNETPKESKAPELSASESLKRFEEVLNKA